MEKPTKKTECTIRDNGPIIIKGDFTLLDAQGNELPIADPTYLCRCGHSKNKPFCDGMHKQIGFKTI